MQEYIEHLQEVFALFGPVSARRMFGGYGLYHDGVMFGLVADSTLYLKVDAINKPDFERKGLGPFEFNKSGKLIKMSYYQAPEEIMDDLELAAQWARSAHEAALRSRLK
ncbi:TfoX family protein [Natronospirillum operosum]|uniref:TfoX family protein n=1 Tax=Natronospirillum operosum TaxID=2759953 RepID=A0A4Z0WIC3_9GAMM|nr:TfoX/Sxy family protein [Natronospirillum operosum]TGG94875.1 TfoX family protein [Natronospirillum operosum]